MPGRALGGAGLLRALPWNRKTQHRTLSRATGPLLGFCPLSVGAPDVKKASRGDGILNEGSANPRGGRLHALLQPER